MSCVERACGNDSRTVWVSAPAAAAAAAHVIYPSQHTRTTHRNPRPRAEPQAGQLQPAMAHKPVCFRHGPAEFERAAACPRPGRRRTAGAAVLPLLPFDCSVSAMCAGVFLEVGVGPSEAALESSRALSAIAAVLTNSSSESGSTASSSGRPHNYHYLVSA